MRSKDKIHAEHLANSKQEVEDEKTPRNKSLHPTPSRRVEPHMLSQRVSRLRALYPL